MIKANILLFLALFGCMTKPKVELPTKYVGSDLSYVNEILDCGGEYRSEGTLVDPYTLFAEKGNNLVRLRLWHNPEWSGYSDFEDVKLAIQRSKAEGMAVLLDFHYSDTWADPQHQVIPAAWANVEDLSILSDSLYNYTYQTLSKLHSDDLLPEFVQVGNEINIEIMQDSANMVVDTIDWKRNLILINAGLKAVTDFSKETQVDIQKMIHIAQPENALWWFSEALEYGLADFEYIGLSYYPKWSTYGLDKLSVAIDSLIGTYDKELMIVETAYPHTLMNVDAAHNILGKDALILDYPATPEGQLAFMNKLKKVTFDAGGKGVIYWEPAWVTSDCSTRWGQGSHWENASFFDGENGNRALVSFDFFQNEPNNN
jgi:arabinogalactan endo-1,4-beta-galactosidase